MNEAITDLTLIRLRSLPEMDAAVLLDTRLRCLEAEFKRSFLEMGIICVEVQERRLWASLCDFDGVPYHSFEAWVCSAAPQCRRQCFSAMAAVKELTEIPMHELAEIPQCNLAQLRKLSSGVRQQPEVIAAAKCLSEDDFRSKIKESFPDQHISNRRRMVLNFDEGDYETVCTWLDAIGEALDLTDREGELLALAIDWQQEHSGEHEGVRG
jgi:hypothetical protein